VFITGANGFIGRALRDRLSELGAEVTGVDLDADPSAGVLAGSTLQPERWVDQLEGIDAIIHTAAIVSNAAALEEAWSVNVLGTRRTVAAAAAAGVRRFLHVSSIMAYGFDYPPGVDESYPVRVCGHSYPDTRVNSEAVVLAAHAAGEIDCTIVRPGDVIGPGSIWVREAVRLAKVRQLVLPARGRGSFTPIFIDNLVDGILLALTAEIAVGQIYTLTDGVEVPAIEYFGRLAELAGSRAMTMPTAVAVPLTSGVGGLLRRLGRRSELTAATMLMLARTGGYSTEKARSQLGFEPRIPFDGAMEACEAWVRAEGLV
jgi:nucleoside-diphosphate-sugar epimerase